MKLLCGIIMGDLKTEEGTRTALQLTCCMENEGAMICSCNVYLCGGHKEGTQAQFEITPHEQIGVRVCVCVCFL